MLEYFFIRSLFYRSYSILGVSNLINYLNTRLNQIWLGKECSIELIELFLCWNLLFRLHFKYIRNPCFKVVLGSLDLLRELLHLILRNLRVLKRFSLHSMSFRSSRNYLWSLIFWNFGSETGRSIITCIYFILIRATSDPRIFNSYCSISLGSFFFIFKFFPKSYGGSWIFKFWGIRRWIFLIHIVCYLIDTWRSFWEFLFSLNILNGSKCHIAHTGTRRMTCFLTEEALDGRADRLQMSSLMTIVAYNVLIGGETLISSKVSWYKHFLFPN